MIGVSFKMCHVTVSWEPGDKNENMSQNICSAAQLNLSGGWKSDGSGRVVPSYLHPY